MRRFALFFRESEIFLLPMDIWALLISVIPGILFCIISYFFIDTKQKESLIFLVLAFFAGALISGVAFYIERAFFSIFDSSSHSFLQVVRDSFVVVALTEELLKVIALVAVTFWGTHMNEPIDAIIYSFFVAMGFATIENALYAYTFGWETSLFRAFTAVPAHACFGIMMGYLYALYHFKLSTARSTISLLIFLVCIILAHGLYDFFILQDFSEYLLLGSVLILLIYIYVSIRLIKALRLVSQ